MDKLEDLDGKQRSPLMMGLIIALYATAAGLCLAFFTNITDFFRYAFSLLALFIGIRFFKNYDRLAYRIIFIVFAIIFFLLFTVVYAMFIFYKENPELFTNVS